jgi:hypothetical protein
MLLFFRTIGLHLLVMINLFRNNFSISRYLFVCYVFSILAIEISIADKAIEKCTYHVVSQDLPGSDVEKDTEEWNDDPATENCNHFFTYNIIMPEISWLISNILPPVVYLGSWFAPPQV